MPTPIVITQYDSVTVSEIPANAQACAGYVGGAWPNFSLLVARFPHARHKSIAVNASENADILDIEAGDAIPAQAPAWIRRQQARGLKLPGVYSMASEMPQVVAELDRAGIHRSEYVLWVAHVTPSTPTPPFEQGADAVQHTFTALGRNLDASVCLPSFWGADPSPPVVNGPHYEWFSDRAFRIFGRLLSERTHVKLYDRLRAKQTRRLHPYRAVLAVERRYLRSLAGRVLRVAKAQTTAAGRPSWGREHRGWRYQQLIHRAQGQRFV